MRTVVPDLRTLWRLAADESLDVLGVSAPFLLTCRKQGLSPGSELDLTGLRQVGSLLETPCPGEAQRRTSQHGTGRIWGSGVTRTAAATALPTSSRSATPGGTATG